MEPKEIFEKHYGKTVNQLTHVVKRYGWILEGSVAYEVSTNPRESMWGLTVIDWDEVTGETQEQNDERFTALIEFAVNMYIESLQKKYQWKNAIQ